MKKIKVIYISGIGRSGSTLLDIILSTSEKVFSVGEIFKYNQMLRENIKCSCGKKVKDCSFWKDFDGKDFKIKNRYNLKDYLQTIIFLILPFSKKKKYSKSDNFQLYKKILKKASKKVRYILDSSKDPVRLFELFQIKKIELYNISIFRDGRGVANSFNSKTQSKGKNYFISLFKWIFINSFLNKLINKNNNRNLKN